MLGRNRQVEVDKKRHFESFARRFALDAKMFKCRAAVHVEDKDDIVFWNMILNHFLPQYKFHFIAGSRNEFGHVTSGVTQCLKYYDYLSSDFIICIDSDYRYLLEDKGMDAEHFVIQTYTYSFENHHCYVGRLDEVCEHVTKYKNVIFDFKYFLGEYSKIIYRLFLWHLYSLSVDESFFSKSEFNQMLCVGEICAKRFSVNADKFLMIIKSRVNRKIEQFERMYPDINIHVIEKRVMRLGLRPENTYLFLRGHNIYDMVSALCKDVCRSILLSEKVRKPREAINNLYKSRGGVDSVLKQSVSFGQYELMDKIGKDLAIIYGE